ncbi:MAG: N-acetylneuraminate synthase family protein [Nitrospirae bacterium]|nr:N-acetylneuraminate synthase family protein [Nitrospirota bacterium]
MESYIIAEIGINYNGLLENCFKLIDVAAKAGCNAAKFQYFTAKGMYPKSAGKLDWKDAEKEYSYDIYEAAKTFELPSDWIDDIIGHCQSRNIDFLSSVMEPCGVDYLIEMGMKRIKLSSYVLTNLPLVEHCAKTGLPIILSTGGSTLSEVDDAVSNILLYNNKLSLMHCSIKYPTVLQDCNVGVIETLQSAYPDLAVGWSDHTSEVWEAPVQAVYVGAKLIEKHITLDKKMEGPDHFFALEPDELKLMVEKIRQAEVDYANGNVVIDKTIYGNTAKTVYPQEKYLRDFCFMKLYAAQDIKAGDVITPYMVSVLRPGKKEHGLEPKYIKLFQNYRVTAKKDVNFEEPITWEVIL